MTGYLCEHQNKCYLLILSNSQSWTKTTAAYCNLKSLDKTWYLIKVVLKPRSLLFQFVCCILWSRFRKYISVFYQAAENWEKFHKAEQFSFLLQLTSASFLWKGFCSVCCRSLMKETDQFDWCRTWFFFSLRAINYA